MEKVKDFLKSKYLWIEGVLLTCFIMVFIYALYSNEKNVFLEKDFNNNKTELTQLQSKYSESQKNLSESQKNLKEKEDKIKELEQEEKQKEINNNITELENKKQELEKEKQSLETKIEELKKVSTTKSTKSTEEEKNNNTNNNTKTTTKTATSTTAKVTSNENDNSQIVYITNSGKKYHKSGCSYLKKSKIETTLSKAQSQGYTPCSKCY